MLHCLLSLKKSLPLILLTALAASVCFAQSGRPQQSAELRLSWEGTSGVNRYRLQVSRDEQFTDLVFDRAVEGREYVISDLPLGDYYWHVAPATAETGTFSAPRKVVLSRETTSKSTTNARNPKTSGAQPNLTGWSAATGNVAQPIALRLRDQNAPDVVGVNSEGMVFALDATNGVALWTARFRPNAKRGEPIGNNGAQPFQPIALGAAGGLENVLVAYDGGVRVLEGATGRELWRAALPGRAASAVVGDFNGDGAMEVAVFQDNPAGLSFLNALTGRSLGEGKLEAAIIGTPAAVVSKVEAGVLLALADGHLDLRNMKGERVRTTKLDVQFTTQPLIVQATQGVLAMLGTDKGLIAVDTSTLKPIWRVATEGDAPRGQLVAADLDNDGSPEVVMITRRGRTVAVSTANGKIKWYANIPTRAGSPVLADLNGDGAMDVLIASDSSNVIGHEGRSGQLLFGSDKSTINTTGNMEDERATYQTCAYVGRRADNAGASAAPLVVCNDPAGGGLSAIQMPSGK
jgi:outer membrane protein assembly factor BamB